MSIAVIDWVWKNSTQKGSALLTLLAIADNANHDGGGAHPSMQYLASKIRMSQRQAQRLVHDLIASGELEVESFSHSRGKANTFRVVMDHRGAADTGDNLSPVDDPPPGKDTDDNLSPEPVGAPGSDPDPQTTPETPSGDIAMSTTGDTVMSPRPSFNRPVEPSGDDPVADAPDAADQQPTQSGEVSPHTAVMAWYREELGYQIPNGGKEGAALKWLLNHDYTLDQIRGCYRSLKQQPFYSDRHLSLQTVKEQIGPWCQKQTRPQTTTQPRRGDGNGFHTRRMVQEAAIPFKQQVYQ